MYQAIEIDQELYKTLVAAFGEASLKEKFNDIILSGIESLIEKYNRKILEFEEKYGVSFKEFEIMWDANKIKNPHSYEAESDFMDWEMLEMEKRNLIMIFSRVHK